MKILVVNCGSSSLKYQLIDMNGEKLLAKGIFERIGELEESSITHKVNGEKYVVKSPAKDHTDAIKVVLEQLVHPEYGVIKDLSEISAVGHRLVHGGEKFSHSVVIDEKVIEDYAACSSLAPLHNPATILGIRACQEAMPGVPMVGVFDTAFHQTMPKQNYLYPIPYEFYEKYGIRKYGFHGTSHRFVANRVAELLNRNIEDLKVITCHIGQGSSICAINGGKSVDTSMGLTPLAGIPMATRSGDIDPAIIPYIMKKENLQPEDVEEMLNKQSGAWGVSGVSSDYRDVEDGYNMQDPRSVLALDSQAYKIAQYIGQYYITLGGLDALVFTGGVGENGLETRQRICEYLKVLGITLDLEANNMKGKEKCISTADSKIPVFVIPTNEELMIARDTHKLIMNQ